MAYLGRYYADKIRGAAKLAIFREGGRQDKQYLDESVAHLKDAVEEWKAYAAILSLQYKTSLLARTHLLDWNSTLKEVEKEVVSVQNEGDYSKVRFANLKDGAHLTEGSYLRVEVEASDGHGIRELKLYLNGQIIKAEDNAGVRNQQVIQIAVGNVSKYNAEDWRDKIHQVILNEGEQLMDGEIRDFPRLGCFLTLEKDGKLALVSGTPSIREGPIWNTVGKADRPTPQPIPYRFYTLVENGKLVIYRYKPNHPKLKIYETRPTPGPGSYKLGITASGKLAVFREVEGDEKKIAWMSN